MAMQLESTDIEAADGTRLRIWEQSPIDATQAVLFVHGATYPGRAMFAPSVPARDSVSWLNVCADSGRAAFAIDIRGYGDSERPATLAEPPEANQPIVRAITAANDVADALAFIRERYDYVHLVGCSWGTMICGHLLSEEAPNISSLTQLAPVLFISEETKDRFAPDDPLPAYRILRQSAVKTRWNDQFPDTVTAVKQRGGSKTSDPIFEAFWDALWESGQAMKHDDESVVQAPNGAVLDLLMSADGEHVYDPAEITVPTLVIRGSLDPTATRDDALKLYDTLGATDDRKTYVEIAGGSHFLHLEQRRNVLHDTVRTFQCRYEE